MTLLDRLQAAPASSRGSDGRPSRGGLRQYGMIGALVVIVVLFELLTDGILLKPLNVTNLIMQNGYVLVLAIGMMLVIINREIDLSVGSVAALVGALTGVGIVSWGLPWPVVVVLALAAGGLIGAFQGFWVAYMRIPAFIVTLGGMLLFRGLSMVVLQGQSLAPFPAGFRQIGSGFVPEFGGDDLHLATVLLGIAAAGVLVWNDWRSRARRRVYGLSVPDLRWFVLKAVTIVVVIGAFTWVLAVYQGLPIVGLVVIVLTVAYSFVMTSTVMGRHVYAVGGNERAAQLSGIATKRTKFWVFVNMGVLAALAGLMFAARLNAATPKAGTNFELDAIAAAFIGGASASGGVGTVVGAIVGGLVMGVMNNGMSLLGLGVDWQQAIKGGVLMLAVAFDVYNKNKSR
ncbi:sugar ABC transporter permease [Sphaerisporangium album]|uniref:Xylose transport system permease protein XylH n=1 Tax=Sphaerisporangium album TaxID=509200 RepID=A0A367FJD6_9ACTN|nr:multiple monosaccharide ABC transporter permease [Sphaerisporangium album]RCG30496.1 sugar ABC transporter permease [Sphaerisporangium album]